MDVREKLDEALKDISITDEEMLDAFFAFANEHLAHAIEAVNETNQILQEIKKEINAWSLGERLLKYAEAVITLTKSLEETQNIFATSAVAYHRTESELFAWKKK